MCFKTIKSWFTGVPPVSSQPTATPLVQDTMTILHPEEPFDPSKTLENTDIDEALDNWCIDYNVPVKHREYWKTQIVIELDPDYPAPAGTWDGVDGKRHLKAQPGYFNSGVIAHEQAHNCYSLMTQDEKNEFSDTYASLKTTNPLITHLYSINTYGLTNDIEGHAEVYRYLCEIMPAELKQYYPKLF